jgi:Family of unknown function (DUF6088)
MATMASIRQSIQRKPKGKPFTAVAMLKYGERAAVDQALSRLAAAGEIMRLIHGVYVRPEENRFVGKVMPEPFEIAKFIAKKTNSEVHVSEAEIARQFGLTTQVPTQPLYLTSRRSRVFKIGNLEVTLKHVCERKLALFHSKSGVAILALWYLGKQLVNSETIEQIRKKLSLHEFQAFLSSKEKMPIWLSKIIVAYKKEHQYA